MKVLLATGADSRYMRLVQGLVASIRRFAEFDAHDLAFLDLGCSESDREWLGQHFTQVVRASWPFSLPRPQGYDSNVYKPFLPEFFPGYDIYVWLDADTWVQDPGALELYVSRARLGNLAVTPELHRAYDVLHQYRSRMWGWMYTRYIALYDERTARRLSMYPACNAGVLAYPGDGEHWRTWGRLLEEGLAISHAHSYDQATLNYGLYKGLLSPYEVLPPQCNWVCHLAAPLFDAGKNLLREPVPPFERIGIVHLTADVKWEPMRVHLGTGERCEKHLDYFGIHGDSEEEWGAVPGTGEGPPDPA